VLARGEFERVEDRRAVARLSSGFFLKFQIG